MVTNLVDHICERFGHLLITLDQPWLSRHHLQLFADAIYNKGAALFTCWGFVDGTVHPMCRPKENQRAVYNGHKRVHAIKFQSVVAPNGLLESLRLTMCLRRRPIEVCEQARSSCLAKFDYETQIGQRPKYFGAKLTIFYTNHGSHLGT